MLLTVSTSSGQQLTAVVVNTHTVILVLSVVGKDHYTQRMIILHFLM